MYPYSKETTDSLFTVRNTATSALTADITSVDTQATVINSSSFPTGRFICSIGQELIIASSKDDLTNTIYFEERGAFDSVAAPHATADRVNCNITAQHYETLRDVAIAMQDNTWSYRAPVEAILQTPPVSPTVGEWYIAATGATGAWTGFDDKLVQYTASGWQEVQPSLGFLVYDKDTENLYKFTSRGWEPGATANLPTNTKTSNYQAVNGELVRCNTTAGSFIVTLPQSPEDGDVVAILDTANWFKENNLIVARGSITQNIQGTLDSIALNISGTYIEFFWNAATNDWRLMETPTYVPVTSVMGRIGNVLGQSGDYTAGQITVTPVGNIAATDVQAALAELDTDKEPADSTILKEADIGVTVQGYDATLLNNADIGVSVQPYNANTVVDAGYVHTDNNYTNSDKSKLDSITLGTTVATLVDGVVPSNQLPSYVDDVLEFADLASFPGTGESGKIYIALDNNAQYRWSGTVYIAITSGAVVSVAGKTGIVLLDKNDVGLSNVDNTSDTNKPISTATQTALNAKASNDLVYDYIGTTSSGERINTNLLTTESGEGVGWPGGLPTGVVADSSEPVDGLIGVGLGLASRIGVLADLTTTNKTSAVAAINELNSGAVQTIPQSPIEQVFGADMTFPISPSSVVVFNLDADREILLFKGSLAVYNRTTKEMGAVVGFSVSSPPYQQIAVVSENSCIVFFSLSGSQDITAIGVSITGTVVTLGAPVAYTTGSILSSHGLPTVVGGTVILPYTRTGPIKSVLPATISGTTVTLGSQTNLTGTTNSTPPIAIEHDANTLVVLHNSTSTTYAIPFAVSGLTLTVGTEASITMGSGTAVTQFSEKLTSGRYIVGSTGSLVVALLEISGTVASFVSNTTVGSVVPPFTSWGIGNDVLIGWGSSGSNVVINNLTRISDSSGTITSTGLGAIGANTFFATPEGVFSTAGLKYDVSGVGVGITRSEKHLLSSCKLPVIDTKTQSPRSPAVNTATINALRRGNRIASLVIDTTIAAGNVYTYALSYYYDGVTAKHTLPPKGIIASVSNNATSSDGSGCWILQTVDTINPLVVNIRRFELA